MKVILAFFVLIVCALAIQENPELVNEYDERNPDNSYYFVYETGDGQRREETGEFEEVNGEKSLRVRGKFSYLGPDGIFYEVNYLSDKDGFQPKGKHLPGVKNMKDTFKSMMIGMKPSIKRIQPNLIASLTG